MGEASFEDIFTTYYQSPTPGRAIAALESAARSDPGWLDRDRRTLEVYFFSVIARTYPPVLRDFEALFDRQPSLFILDVLAETDEEAMRGFLDARLGEERFRLFRHQMRDVVQGSAGPHLHPLDHPVRDELDLNLLWAEFLATGETQSVIRIIDILESPDVIPRRLLIPYLSSRERRRVAAKAAARSSLRANACDHERVLEVCEAQSALHSGRAKLDLLEISAAARRSRGDEARAAVWAEQYQQLTAADIETRRLLARATRSDDSDGNDGSGSRPPARGLARMTSRLSDGFEPMILLMVVFLLPFAIVGALVGGAIGSAISVYLLGDRWTVPIVIAGMVLGVIATFFYLFRYLFRSRSRDS